MDIKDFRGLVEAYSEVYAPQEVAEALDKKFNSMRKRGGKSAPPEERSVGGEMNRKTKDYWADNLGKSRDRGKGNRAARRVAALKNEELDIFDIVLEFLQVKGYAETLEEAEWMMANLLNKEAIDIILEEMHNDDEDEEDEKEMKRGKKSKKEDEDEDEDELSEASHPTKADALLSKLRAKRG